MRGATRALRALACACALLAAAAPPPPPPHLPEPRPATSAAAGAAAGAGCAAGAGRLHLAFTCTAERGQRRCEQRRRAAAARRCALPALLRCVASAAPPALGALSVVVQGAGAAGAVGGEVHESLHELRALRLLRKLWLRGAALRPARGWLPALPCLRFLELRGAALAELPEGAFESLAGLESLSLPDNSIVAVHENAFRGLSNLTELSLCRNALTALPAALLRPTAALQRLLLLHNPLRTLPRLPPALTEIHLDNNDTSALVPPADAGATGELVKLVAQRCGLHAPPAALLRGARALLHLNLAVNRIGLLSGAALADLTALESLDLSRNSITRIHPEAFLALVSLRELHLADNRLAGWPRAALAPLRALAVLDLSFNAIAALSDDDLTPLGAASVDLTNNNITRVRPGAAAAGDFEATLAFNATLRLTGNPLACDCDIYEFAATLAARSRGGAAEDARCASPPPLLGAPLLAVAPAALQCALPTPACPPRCACAVRPAAPRAERLELRCWAVPRALPLHAARGATGARLRLLSAAALGPGGLGALPRAVRRLDLSALGLAAAPRAPPRSPPLHVNLTGNALTGAPVALLEAGHEVLLAGNPLACDCAHRESLAALRRHRRRVHDAAALRCADGAAVDAVDAARACAARDAAVLGGAAGAALLATAALLALGARFRLEARLLARRLGLAPAAGGRRARRTGRAGRAGRSWRYDAYVACCESDEEWVLAELAPRLERGRALRLCVAARDWQAGGAVGALVARSVRESRRTLAVVSAGWARWRWGAAAFQAAHARGRALVVVRGAVARAALGAELRAYLATGSYVRAEEPLAWARLRAALLRGG